MITMREFSGETDKEQMSALVHQYPADNLHVVDLPYRLSSWAFDYPENIGLWFDQERQLIAWAMLQTPFWTLDFAYHPQIDKRLCQEILAWADNRAQESLGSPSGRPMWFVNVFDRQKDRIADLEAAGFTCQANVGQDSWSKILMTRPMHAAIPIGPLPPGFEIRSLAGEEEVDAYVQLHRSVFESKNMTVEWRLRVLQRPEYIPHLDLVVVMPNNELVAFGICWFDKARLPVAQPCGQIEPMGVHRAYRNMGIGKAILIEAIRRLRDMGAKQIFVETDEDRSAAVALYESAGFSIEERVLVYRKDYSR